MSVKILILKTNIYVKFNFALSGRVRQTLKQLAAPRLRPGAGCLTSKCTRCIKARSTNVNRSISLNAIPNEVISPDSWLQQMGLIVSIKTKQLKPSLVLFGTDKNPVNLHMREMKPADTLKRCEHCKTKSMHSKRPLCRQTRNDIDMRVSRPTPTHPDKAQCVKLGYKCSQITGKHR